MQNISNSFISLQRKKSEMEEKIKCYFVNSFAEEGLLGNPAAVAIVDSWPSDDCMQRIALKNNL